MDSLEELIPVLRDLVPLIRNDLARQGYDTEIGSTGRNNAEQEAAIRNGGSSKIFGKSWHNVKSQPADRCGLVKSCACDLWFVSLRGASGKPKIFDWEVKEYKILGEVAESYGLTWGGRFKNVFDGPHVQAPSLASPMAEHWAMSEEGLDKFCRLQIAGTKKLRGIV